MWEIKFKCKITGNIFATSHGKGVVDGIGGTVKQSVLREVKTGQNHISDGSEYES